MGTIGTVHAETPPPIVLKANLTKGMHWDQATPGSIYKTILRTHAVLDFVTLKVAAGEYNNVAKIRATISFISRKTGNKESGPTTLEYYAPNVGLVKLDILEKNGTVAPFLELLSYIPGAP